MAAHSTQQNNNRALVYGPIFIGHFFVHIAQKWRGTSQIETRGPICTKKNVGRLATVGPDA